MYTTRLAERVIRSSMRGLSYSHSQRVASRASLLSMCCTWCPAPGVPRGTCREANTSPCFPTSLPGALQGTLRKPRPSASPSLPQCICEYLLRLSWWWGEPPLQMFHLPSTTLSFSLCAFFFFKVTFLVTIFKVYWIYRIASALWFSFLACGISAPWPGIEPTCHALEGKALTTGPPGKSPLSFSWDNHSQSAASSSLGHSRESCRVCAEPHPQVGFDWSRGPNSQHIVHWTSVPVEY